MAKANHSSPKIEKGAVNQPTIVIPVTTSEERILPSGKKAIIKKFKGRHVRLAQEQIAATGAGGDTGVLMFTLISSCVSIDGKPVSFEDLDNMPGADALMLEMEFSTANFQARKETETDTLTDGEMRLPSGKKAVIKEFLGKHVREAQRRMSDMNQSAEGGSGALIFMLISMLTTIDGAPIVYEDIDEMEGMDVLVLEGEFSAANFR